MTRKLSLLVLVIVLCSGTVALDAQDAPRPQLGIGLEEGGPPLVISMVAEGSTAAAMGLHVGDAILAFNDTPIEDLDVLRTQIAGTAIGEQFTLTIRRDGEEMTLTGEMQAYSPPTVVGSPAPELQAERWANLPEGVESLSLADLRGNVVLINCFQSWCPGCHSRGLPNHKAMDNRFGENPRYTSIYLQTVFEGYETNTFERGAEVLAHFGIEQPYGHDAGNPEGGNGNRPAFMRDYHTRGTPWTVLVDHNGTVRLSAFTPGDAEALAGQIQALLQEAEEDANGEESEADDPEVFPYDEAHPAAGRWLGSLTVAPSRTVPMELRLTAPSVDSEEWAGSLWMLTSGLVDAGFGTVQADSDTLHAEMEIAAAGLHLEVDGTISEDGQTLEGTMAQSAPDGEPQWFEFALRRLPLPEELETMEQWQGVIEAPVMELEIEVTIATTPGGTAVACMDIPAQQAFGFTLFEVEYSETGMSFVLVGSAGRAEVTGTFGEDGDTFTGTMTQQGMEMPVRLQRGELEARPVNRPQNPVGPFPYVILDDVHVENPAAEDVVLAGTLVVPEGDGPFPAAVLVSGSGPQDRNESLMGHHPFWVLADYLVRRGIAVLRYDDRGVGASTGAFDAATTHDFASDALAGVRYLAAREVIDARRIGIIGHSEGGLVGPLAASLAPEEVAFVVMLAGPGVTGEEILYEQAALIARAEGADEETIAEQRETQERIFRLLRHGYSDRVMRALALQMAAEQMEDLPEEERPSEEEIEAQAEAQLRRLCTPWFRRFLVHDPRPVLREVQCPVLALFGTLDLQVPWQQNAPEVMRALADGGNPDVTVRTLPGLNHLFQHATTGAPSEYASIEETFAPIALRAVGDWIVTRMLEEE